MSQFTLNAKDDDFYSLETESGGYRPEMPGARAAQRSRTAQAQAEGEAMLASVREEGKMTERSQELDDDYRAEQTRATKARIESDPVARRALRRSEARERARAQSTARKAAETQRRENFRNPQSTPEYAAQQARNAEYQQTDAARSQAKEDAIRPIRDAALARNAAAAAATTRPKTADEKLMSLRRIGTKYGRPVDFAEVRGDDGRTATYTAPTREGQVAYTRRKVAPAAGLAAATAKGKTAPQLDLSSKSPVGQMPVRPIAGGSSPAFTPPAMPMLNGSQQATNPSILAGTPPMADPNAAAAIASFNKSAELQPRRVSSPAQNANLQNLQAGDNVPTMIDVPRRAVSQTGQAIEAAAGGIVKAIQNTSLVNPAAGRSSSVRPTYESSTISGRPITTRVEAVTPSRPQPRMLAQGADPNKKTPLMAN